MSRSVLPFEADDISAVARHLRAGLAKLGRAPGHLDMLHLLARAAGHSNFQSYRAQMSARARMERAETEAPATVDYAQVERMARHFDGSGRLAHWPAKTSQQELCLWGVWSFLPPGGLWDETEVNRRLCALHTFGDHALLRRSLCDLGLMGRAADGREYRRTEKRPPAAAVALIRHLSARAGRQA